MRYRAECLTPTLAGDGTALSPIDYMVWKDQVNVLNQRRIFTLLAKGPRLDNYLTQIKKDEKLDFATWGGFAQNYAERRIPFEDPTYATYWQRLRAEHCHIPTFARTYSGPYLPGSVLRGAIRTALVASRISPATLSMVDALFQGDRAPRRPGETADHHTLGRPTHDALKGYLIADSDTATNTAFHVHMLRTATLVEVRTSAQSTKIALGWRTAPRGSVEPRRIDESTPAFAEMALAGAAFEGAWSESSFFQSPEAAKALGWRHPLTRDRLLAAANDYAQSLLDAHAEYAAACELHALGATLEHLRARLQQARDSGTSCLLNIGWATGLLCKTAFPNTRDEAYRAVLARQPYYTRAIKSGLPFPKTRRIVFQKNQPVTLPGWVLLEVR